MLRRQRYKSTHFFLVTTFAVLWLQEGCGGAARDEAGTREEGRSQNGRIKEHQRQSVRRALECGQFCMGVKGKDF